MESKSEYKPRMIRHGPGSLKWIPERLRMAFVPRNSKATPDYLKSWGSRPVAKRKTALTGQ